MTQGAEQMEFENTYWRLRAQRAEDELNRLTQTLARLVMENQMLKERENGRKDLEQPLERGRDPEGDS
jgi:hypothetical protein